MARGNGKSWDRCSTASLEIDENASDESDFFLVRKTDDSSSNTDMGAASVSNTNDAGGGSDTQSRAVSSRAPSPPVSLSHSVSMSTASQQLNTLRLSSAGVSFLNSVGNGGAGVNLTAAVNRKRKIEKEEKESVGREGRKTRTDSQHTTASASAELVGSSVGPADPAAVPAAAAVTMVFGRQYARATGAADLTRNSSADGDRAVHWHPSLTTDVDQGLAADFDDSLTGLGGNLSSTTYNMSEALLALPTISNMSAILKNEVSSLHSDSSSGCGTGHDSLIGMSGAGVVGKLTSMSTDHFSTSPLGGATNGMAAMLTGRQRGHAAAVVVTDPVKPTVQRFQYVLNAATSLATKLSEEPITYLNQGQSYEIRIKKLGDLSQCCDRLYQTRLKLCFHERRLQYMEKQQLDAWKNSRPGDRLLEIDIPLSYGIFDVRQGPSALNCCEFLWSPDKDVGVYIKVHSVSTEFTPKKHGGEKGVPFRLQAETFSTPVSSACLLHCAASQIKVFKLKGADRKHKQDRERILKRPPAEQEKYQPSFECTVLAECAPDLLHNNTPVVTHPSPPSAPAPAALLLASSVSPGSPPALLPAERYSGSPTGSVADDESAVSQELFVPATLSSPCSATSPSPSTPSIHPQQQPQPPPTTTTTPSTTNNNSQQSAKSANSSIVPTSGSTCRQVCEWLVSQRFAGPAATLRNYTGADLLRLSRDDVVQLCGLTDGIRLFNCLHGRLIAPRLTIYVCVASSSVYHALCLHQSTRSEVLRKLAPLLAPATVSSVSRLCVEGPAGVSVLLTDEVVRHMPNDSLFSLETQSMPGETIHVMLRKASPHWNNNSFSVSSTLNHST